ncbi:MAG: oligosaccharide flippase family protein [Patescibacteria group bacterium]
MWNKGKNWLGWLSSRVFKNPLIAGSAVLFVGTMIANFGGYLYHLLMGRMLGPANYGTLESLISLLYLLGIPMGALSLVIVKFVSAFKGQKKLSAIKSMFLTYTQIFFLFGVVGLAVFFLFISPISSFLHLKEKFSLIIIGAISFISIFTTINRSFLQGILYFGTLAASGIIEVFLKLFLAVLFVWLGFGVSGAILPILIGGIVAYIFTVIFLKGAVWDGQKEALDYLAMVWYALPVFFSTLAFTSLYTTDIILVRHFLTASEAGFYAALSVLGKIIFFISGPVVTVMFPLVSERQANGKQYTNLLFLSLGLVFLTCFGASLVYLLFPELMIKILFGREYLAASAYLFLFAIFLSFYSLSFLLTNFYLSIREVKIVALPMLAALSQIIVITLFHQTLLQVIWISLAITALLFTSQMVYYFYALKGKRTSFSHHSGL